MRGSGEAPSRRARRSAAARVAAGGLASACLLAGAACGGSGSPTAATAHSPTTADAPAAAAGGQPGPASTVAARSRPSPTRTSAPAPTATTPSSSTTAPSGPRSYPPPAVGHYAFRTTGTTQSGGQQQTVDRTGDMTIAAIGTDAVRQTSPDRSQIVDLVYRPDGVLLTRYEVHYAGGAIVKVFTLPGPVLWGPVPTDPGRTWSWTIRSDDGATTVKQDSEVRPRESRRIAGHTVLLDVVESRVTVSGDITGTATIVTWIDPARRFGVRYTEQSQFQSGIFSMSSNTTAELQ